MEAQKSREETSFSAFTPNAAPPLEDDPATTSNDNGELKETAPPLNSRLLQFEATMAALRANASIQLPNEELVEMGRQWEEITSFMQAISASKSDDSRGIGNHTRGHFPSDTHVDSATSVLGKRRREEEEDPVEVRETERALMRRGVTDTGIVALPQTEAEAVGSAGDGRPSAKRRRTPAMLAFLAGGLAAWAALGLDLGV